MKTKKNFMKKQLIILTIFYVISIISIYSFQTFLPATMNNLIFKQTCYYILGFLLILALKKVGITRILKYSFFIYIANIILLLAVLLFGDEINGARAWFVIPFVGSFQPSEFMKIGIILFSAKILEKTEIRSLKDEFFVILKLLIVILIPAVLTFLEPDTGAVIAYLVIFLVMLFISGIRYRWFVIFGLVAGGLLASFLYLFFNKPNLFIDILGSDFFYRLDRIFDWRSASGMQLENSLLAIAGAGILGNGINTIPIYYPEGQTDFIFTSFASCFGFIGVLILIGLIVFFDINLVSKALTTKKKIYKFIITSFVGVLLYQQVQNIAMTVGLLPIMGITLPFISYGGSSLISFMVIMGIIFAIDDQDVKNHNY